MNIWYFMMIVFGILFSVTIGSFMAAFPDNGFHIRRLGLSMLVLGTLPWTILFFKFFKEG